MEDPPTSRSVWASLEWQEAQHQVGMMLNEAGFVKLEEKKLGRGRADLLVYRTVGKKAVIGIVEVKAYRRITMSMQKKAVLQACRYITKLYELHNSKQNWSRRIRVYFICAIYTNDYPTTDMILTPTERREHLPGALRNIMVFNSSPDRLVYQLKQYGLLPNQTHIDDFF